MRPRFGLPAGIALFLGLAPACASTSAVPRAETAAAAPDRSWARTAAFVHVEDDALGWLAAADPRLAIRADTVAPDAMLKHIGTEAILAEDATAQIRGGSLDIFAFRARAHALEQAAKLVRDFRDPLPEAGPLGSTIARPKLERELLARLIEEERTRTDDEAKLGEASGELVRAIVATWKAPSAPQDWLDRDNWLSKHLLEIRDSVRGPGPRTGPSDLDRALYPLERLLSPMQFPRGSAAIAEIRMSLDDDMRAVPAVDVPERLVRDARLHLGVALDPATLKVRLQHIEQRLRDLLTVALASAGDARPAVLARARELLLVQRSCPSVSDARVRSMSPPPEREAICGALQALVEEPSRTPALLALHDDVVLSFAAVMPTPPLRTGLMSNPESDDIDALAGRAREHPVMALGVAFAAELLYGNADADADARLGAWKALGEAPLDVVAREIASR